MLSDHAIEYVLLYSSVRQSLIVYHWRSTYKLCNKSIYRIADFNAT